MSLMTITSILQRCHNERNGVSNYRRHDCLFNLLFRRNVTSTQTSKFRVTGLCEGNSPVTGELSEFTGWIGKIHRWSVNSPHKGPVTRIFFTFANSPPPMSSHFTAFEDRVPVDTWLPIVVTRAACPVANNTGTHGGIITRKHFPHY